MNNASLIQTKTQWRRYLAGQGPQSNTELRIAVAGSVTVEPLEPYLGGHLLRKNIQPRITAAPFNQLRQVCANHETVLGATDLDVIALLWRVEDMFPNAGVEELRGELEQFAQAVAHLRSQFGGTLIVAAPPYPSSPDFALGEIDAAARGMLAFHTLSQSWTQQVLNIGGVRLIDLQGLLLKVGWQHAHDSRKWLLYRQPYTDVFWNEVGLALARTIAAEKVSPKKCIVLDLDNTLWGGIIGEDGLEGIQLAEDFPGSAYREFQRRLLHLKRKGVLLAVASKNNPADALEVFDKHDGMILSREDFAAFEIGWESKVEGIQRIAQRFNIGIDSVVFVDDSAKEIGEVSERLPAVTCILVPEELADLPGIFDDSDLFDFAATTEEDRKRTDMMAAENIRQHLQETMTEEEFRKSLGLEIEVFKVEKQHIARVTQLINKTNQFNLTTIRRTQQEVEALAASPDAAVLAMNVRDKYGDYGLVGVAILKKEEKTSVIDTLLMSCRVLGRGVEDYFMAKIAEAAHALECHELRGRYIPTAKNGIVKDLYERFDFGYDAHSDIWVRRVASVATL